MEPTKYSRVVDKLTDMQYVRILSGQYTEGIPGEHTDWSWRKISAITSSRPFPHIGWVRNRVLLDNCDGQGGGFGCPPIALGNVYRTYGFGPNNYAKEQCQNNFNCKDYNKLRGLHNGLDFSTPAGQPLIWAGSGEGEVVTYTGDADPAIGVHYAGRDVVYGHVSRADVFPSSSNKIVRPGQMIGLSGLDHLHFGYRKGSVFFNPLPYFDSEVQQYTTNIMRGEGGYTGYYDPYYMISFDSSYSGREFWFWGCGSGKYIGILTSIDIGHIPK